MLEHNAAAQCCRIIGVTFQLETGCGVNVMTRKERRRDLKAVNKLGRNKQKHSLRKSEPEYLSGYSILLRFGISFNCTLFARAACPSVAALITSLSL